MTVELIRFTPSPDALCGLAAQMCAGSTGDPLKALRGALDRGHESIAEHASFTFAVEGVSRVLLAQLTRHRHASFSVQSQRYCGVEPEWIIPPTIADACYRAECRMQCNSAYRLMCEMIEQGVPAEDARYIIPQGVTCKLMLTANARELMHIFELRCCNKAQWEIRELADKMLAECRKVAPVLFAHAGAPCQQGRTCPEGSHSCGRPREVTA